jgi:hypothetical protein
VAKRTQLTNLSARIAAGRLEPVGAAAPTADGPQAKRERAKFQPDGRKGVLVRLNPEAWRVLKILGAERMASLQEMMEEAVNDLLQKNGKPPLA